LGYCAALLGFCQIDLFLYIYARKEAVLSSQIEGTQSSLSDLLMFEHSGTPSVPEHDVREVSRYVAAAGLGVQRVPRSMRLLREVHAVLLTDARGNDKTSAEIRTSQNSIGGSKPGDAMFVPPPHTRLRPTLLQPRTRCSNGTANGSPTLANGT
jgi:Fic family protein